MRYPHPPTVTLPSHVPLDAFTLMPNHIHGIIWIVETVDVGATRRVAPTRGAPTDEHPRGPIPGSLGAIIGQFKSIVTKRINALRHTPGTRLWQRNYYEHIIRTDRVLNTIRRYTAENPLGSIKRNRTNHPEDQEAAR